MLYLLNLQQDSPILTQDFFELLLILFEEQISDGCHSFNEPLVIMIEVDRPESCVILKATFL